jgi:hypothetical protein
MNYMASTPMTWKAEPLADEKRRLLDIYPGEDQVDLQGEMITCKALWNSREYYLEKGNIDTDHWTRKAPFQNKSGEPTSPEKFTHRFYEIGRPHRVEGDEKRVRLIGEIYKGNEHADWFWKTITEQQPKMVWYPSIGVRREKSQPQADGTLLTTAVRWINTAMCQEPVNQAVSPIEMYDMEEIAKAMIGGEMNERLGRSPLHEITAEAGLAYALKGLDGIDEVISKHELAESEQQALYELMYACCNRVAVVS